MPSTRDIRRRIKSVKSTAQITKAMQMVASSKMRKAQQAALNGRPFAALAESHPAQRHRRMPAISAIRCMEVREVRKRAVILVSTDKGLCGALNRTCSARPSKFDPQTTLFIAVGSKAAQFLARTRRQAGRPSSPTTTRRGYAEARRSRKFAQDLFLKGEVDAGGGRLHAVHQHAHAAAGLRCSFCRWARSRASG